MMLTVALVVVIPGCGAMLLGLALGRAAARADHVSHEAFHHLKLRALARRFADRRHRDRRRRSRAVAGERRGGQRRVAERRYDSVTSDRPSGPSAGPSRSRDEAAA